MQRCTGLAKLCKHKPIGYSQGQSIASFFFLILNYTEKAKNHCLKMLIASDNANILSRQWSSLSSPHH